jgi:hypothetical protein
MFPPRLVSLIVEQTNLYAAQQVRKVHIKICNFLLDPLAKGVDKFDRRRVL